MPVLKLVTINIFSDLSYWTQRRDLLARGLAALQADIVALQEVHLPENPARWLADQLGFESRYLSSEGRVHPSDEGIALISKLPYHQTMSIELGDQGRVAQAVLLNLEGNPFIVANCHLLWKPGESSERLIQVELMIQWLKGMPGNPPCLICGDFNGTPDSNAIRRITAEYLSAHAAVYHREPDFTTPTPLPRSLGYLIRTALGFWKYVRLRDMSFGWHGTLDYIFVDPRLKVLDSQVVLDQPDRHNPRIYASDHFGIFAKIEIT